MLPAGWAGAGAAPYNNVVGIDPELRDPEHGDYRPALGSPAAAYGCQTFGAARPTAAAVVVADRAVEAVPRRETIDVAGRISADTVWDADHVRVVGDVEVQPGITLTIAPGVRVEFQDYYRLVVNGTLLAVGMADQRIRFTTDEPSRFTVDTAHAGCWNGIRFEDTAATNAPSRLAYCTLEYSKATGGGSGAYPYGGGALSVVGFAQLSVENCVFRHNVADYGGAVFLYRQANVRIAGCLIVDNHALQNASAVCCAYSYPELTNNTIVRNPIHNEANPYIESCAVLSFIAKPVLTNHIIRDNEPSYVYMHTQLWGTKNYYTHYNNVAGYPDLDDNLDVDPRFLAPDGVDGIPGTPDDNFRLHAESPCIDAGWNAAVPPALSQDLDGVTRVFDGDLDGTPVVDMGAFESGDCDGDGVPDVTEITGGQAADCNGNLVPDECELEVFGTSLDCNASGVPDECETLGGGDFDGDGDVDAVDLATFVAALAGPDLAPHAALPECVGALRATFDFNTDGDLDLADFAGLQSAPAR